jgi:hypothetical protein
MFDKEHCSPHNKETDSCIPKNFLVKIADILNDKYECSINHKCSKKKLHKSITNEIKRLSKCNKEACWLNIENIKDGFSSQEYGQLKKYFRPFMPREWYMEPNKWLNTTDINNVLDQYEKQYKNFKYMGASPIDYDLKSDSGECIVNELCKLNLKDLQENNYNSIGVVFNTDKHNEPGQHWFSMYIDLKGKNRKNKPTIYHFDSAVGEAKQEILNLVNDIKEQYMNLHGKDIDFLFNDKKHQSKNTECGIYCLHFLVSMLQGNSFNNYISKKKNDKDMFKFRDRFYIKCNQ